MRPHAARSDAFWCRANLLMTKLQTSSSRSLHTFHCSSPPPRPTPPTPTPTAPGPRLLPPPPISLELASEAAPLVASMVPSRARRCSLGSGCTRIPWPACKRCKAVGWRCDACSGVALERCGPIASHSPAAQTVAVPPRPMRPLSPRLSHQRGGDQVVRGPSRTRARKTKPPHPV
eukprot:357079-Chlamydomonas_euryale.AAC.2